MNIRTVLPLIALSVAAILTAGCTTLREWWHHGLKVGPNYSPPCASVKDAWIDAGDRRIESLADSTRDWWSVFNDPALDALIYSAYEQNLDLRKAGLRILEARANRDMIKGEIWPQSQLGVLGYVHGQVSRELTQDLTQGALKNVFDIWADGLLATWEIDFWGRYRRNLEAADADLDAAVEDYRDVLVLLLSEVAASYVRLCAFQQRLQFARQNETTQRNTLAIVLARQKNGLASELDVQQAQSNLENTRAAIPPLRRGLRQADNQLNVLLGQLPLEPEQRREARPIPQAPAAAAVGIPADLLRRRPDVRRAERAVASQSAQIGIAEADFYPSLSLIGFLGYSGVQPAHLFDASSFTGVVAPVFQWKLLNYGRVLNNYRMQEVRFQETLVDYQRAVLAASREAEDALAGFLQAQERVAHLQKSAQAAEKAVKLVLVQYQQGRADFNRVLDVERDLVQQQDQLVLAQKEVALELIRTYKALGGGWEAFEDCTGVPASDEILPAPRLLDDEGAAELDPESVVEAQGADQG